MTDKIATKTETETKPMSTTETEIVGEIMIVIAIELTRGETGKTEIAIDKETVEDREMEETSIVGNKKKWFNKKIHISKNVAKFNA